MKKKLSINNLQEAINLVPAADVLSFFNNLVDVYHETLQYNKDLAGIEAKKEILITEIKERYSLYHEVFNKIFDQRSQSIEKFFEVIDQGLKKDNNDLVSSGLKSLSDLVSKSPFSDLNELKALLESNKIIEI